MIASLLLLLSSRLRSRHKDYNRRYLEIWNASKYSFFICIIYSFHLLYCWLHFTCNFYVTEKQVSEYLKRCNENCWKYYWHYLTTLWHASPPQSQNHSCIWRWKWLFVFMLNCLLQKNSSVKHSLSIYLIIIIYFCSYNTGWDEKQVLFTRLITILFHETHLHLYPR